MDSLFEPDRLLRQRHRPFRRPGAGSAPGPAGYTPGPVPDSRLPETDTGGAAGTRPERAALLSRPDQSVALRYARRSPGYAPGSPAPPSIATISVGVISLTTLTTISSSKGPPAESNALRRFIMRPALSSSALAPGPGAFREFGPSVSLLLSRPATFCVGRRGDNSQRPPTTEPL